MLRRIALWALCGLAVGFTWALVFYLLGPSRGQYASQADVLGYLSHSLVLQVSAPIALLGRHYAITWYWSAVMNAAIYACAGLLFETVRVMLHPRAAGLRP